MESVCETINLSMEKFNKCGELYRSPIINDKKFMYLSCVYCKAIFWKLDTFLQHLDDAHYTVDTISLNLFKQNDIEMYQGSTDNLTELRTMQYPAIATSSKKSENDPLNEEHLDLSDIMPIGLKIEEGQSIHCTKVDTKLKIDFVKRDADDIKGICNIQNSEYDNANSSEDVYEPDKISSDDDNENEYPKGEYAQDDIVNNNENFIHFNPHNYEDIGETSLKRLTRNRNFIKTIIMAYQKQNILWDGSHNNKIITNEKKKAFGIILKDIKQKFKIRATAQQIESVIKRLKLRFAHHLRLRDKGGTFKPLWFFELIKFLEPHLKGSSVKRPISKQLNNNQLLSLIKVLKENECLWNENNIYHTSAIKKDEILKNITSDFSKMWNLENFNVDIMQNSIDDIIEMAREENVIKMQRKESDKNDNTHKSCNKFYKEIEFLFPHIGPFKCKYCPKIFNDIYAYKFHISRHEGTKPFKCMQCPRELTHKKEYICHLRRHTKECPFQCNACDKSFPSQKEWHRHVVKHGSKPYVCELCANSFYTQHQLTNHMKNHNNIRDHVCPECGKGFTHRGLLRQHLQTHNKTKCFCTHCENIYSNPRSLRKHYVRVHELGQQKSVASKSQYNCQICKITFATIQDAKQHRKEHKQSNPTERRHVCDICGHHFAYPRNLADHKKTHSNIRDQICDVCGKAFTNTNLLNQHKNVHTGEKFLCKVCGKDYAHYRGLCRHITKAHGTNIRDLDIFLDKQKSSSSMQ